jgi:hypothetical protein
MAIARDDRAVAARLAVTVAVFMLLVGQGQVTIIDGESMLAVARGIVHHGSFAVPPELGVPGTDGQSYSKYGLALPLLSVIPVAIVQPIGAVAGRTRLLEAAAASCLMPLIAGFLAAAVFALGRRLGAARPAALLVAAGTVLGTYLLPYGRDFFTEPMVALGLVLMIERSLAGRFGQAGAALAFAVLARPQSAVFAPLLFGFLLLRGDGDGVAAAIRTLPPLAVSCAITVAYNVLRFSDPLEFGYRPPADPGFTTPFLTGASGLLFSPEKSVFVFAPVIVLVPLALVWLWRRDRLTVSLILALFAASFVLAATWWSWEGGWSWGPRLIIPGVAVLLAALAPWIGEHAVRMRVAAALFALGFVISLPTVIAPAGAQLLNRAPGTDGPQIVRQYREVGPLTRQSVRTIGDPAARDDDYRRYLALWQANVVRKIGRPGLVPAVLGTLLLLFALWRLVPPVARELRPASRY